MDAHAVSLLPIFEKKMRLEVPLFQRQYVWNREHQWEPLWEDITRKFVEHLDGRRDARCIFWARWCSIKSRRRRRMWKGVRSSMASNARRGVRHEHQKLQQDLFAADKEFAPRWHQRRKLDETVERAIRRVCRMAERCGVRGGVVERGGL
jgi:hypothetical protein